MKRALYILTLLAWILTSSSCAPKLDSPFFDKDNLSVRAWNVKNAHAIQKMNKDSYTIALVADSHANYKDLSRVVNILNATPGIDFVVHLGDFTEKSLPFEYSYFMEIWGKLRMPSLVVIGNHDAVGFGPRVYNRMFGPLNYAVNAGWLQLILLDANTLETGPIDYPWLEQQLAAEPETIQKRIIFRHTNHDNKVHHTKADAAEFESLVEQYKVSLVVNGHRHSHHHHHGKHSATHQVARVEGQNFSTVTISREGGVVQACRKGVCPREKRHKLHH